MTTKQVKAIEVLTYLNDIRLPTGDKKRAWVLNIVREHLTKIFKATPGLKDNAGRLVRAASIGRPESRSGRRRATKRSWWSMPASSRRKATIAMPG